MIMDSPMGASVLELFHRTRDWHRLDENECDEMCSHFTVVSSYRETMELRTDNKPKIVIAGSGMLTGGRMLNYLETQAQNSNNTLLFVGYQAEGTRGRKLLEGDKELKVYGKWVPFHMEVAEIEGLSAHADHAELMDWMDSIKTNPNVFSLYTVKKRVQKHCKKASRKPMGGMQKFRNYTPSKK